MTESYGLSHAYTTTLLTS